MVDLTKYVLTPNSPSLVVHCLAAVRPDGTLPSLVGAPACSCRRVWFRVFRGDAVEIEERSLMDTTVAGVDVVQGAREESGATAHVRYSAIYTRRRASYVTRSL